MPFSSRDRYGAEELEHPDHGDAEGGVADAGDDEGLAPGGGVLLLRVPEADQGVGAEADPLPPQVEQRQVLGQDQGQHGEDEDVQQGEVAGVGRVVLHVADRVEVDQAADEGDHQGQRQGELVEVQGDGGLEVEIRQPGGVLDLYRGRKLKKGQHRAGEGAPDHAAGNELHPPARQGAPNRALKRPPQRGREQEVIRRDLRVTDPHRHCIIPFISLNISVFTVLRRRCR